MRRRQFIQTVAAGTLSTLFSSPDLSAQMRGMPGVGMRGMFGGTSALGSTIPTGLPLRRLDALANTSAVEDAFRGALTASPYQTSLVPGRVTELWGYNNQCPGPVIELREGQNVKIDFANRLAAQCLAEFP